MMRQGEKNSGITTNLPTTDVIWCNGRNVRFKPGAVYKTFGKTLLTTVPNNVPIRAIFTFKGYDKVIRSVVCSDTQIYSYTNDFTAYQNITPPTRVYSGPTDVWQFAIIGGMPVLTNGVNGIWKWSDFSAALSTLDNAPYNAKCMATAMNRLLFGDVQTGGSTVTSRVLWSRPFDPTKTSIDRYGNGGQLDISIPNTGINAREWIKSFCVTKTTIFAFCDLNIWALDPIEQPYYFKPRLFQEGVGLLARRGFCKVGGVYGGIFFIGHDDIYQIAGDSVIPIGFPIRNALFPNIKKDIADTSFVFYQPDTKDVFFCVPIGEANTPNTAFVYNIELKNWSICDVNYTCHAYSWKESITSWGAMSGSWDSLADKQWDDMSSLGVIPYNVVGDVVGKIYKMDDGYNDNEQPIIARIETGDMVMDDEQLWKMITFVYPSLKPQSKASALLIQVGSRERLDHPIKWSKPFEYIQGVSDYAPIMSLGKYHRIAFYSQQKDDQWIMDGYKFKYILRGGD